jgi:2-hydroxycyclohexanecarboxyl-CoA dehydrogenase
MDLELTGDAAVVTGGASGIGWACAQNLAREGCRVALWDRSAEVNERAITLVTQFGSPSVAKIVDVSDSESVQRAMRETEDSFGGVSHLVHAAAVGSGRFGFPFTNLEPSDWVRVLEVNVAGMVHVGHAVAPGMVTPSGNDGVYRIRCRPDRVADGSAV